MHMSRRNLLSWMGPGAALFSPLYRTLRAEAQGQAAEPILITWNNFFGYEQMFVQNFPSGPIGTLKEGMEPLIPYKSNMIVVGGFEYKFEPGLHGPPNSVVYTGTKSAAGKKSTGPSFDTYVASKLSAKPFPVLTLGHPAAGSDRSITYDNAGNSVPLATDVLAAFARVFGAGVPSMPGIPSPSPAPAAQTNQLLADNRSVLDFAMEDAKALSTRLAASERPRLEQFTESLRAYEKQLSALAAGPTPGSGGGSPSVACKSPVKPSVGPPGKKTLPTDEVTYGKAVADLIVNAVACGMTNVVSVLAIAGAGHDEHHAHDQAALTLAMTQNHTVNAYLLERLKTIPRGAGTAFDHTWFVQWPNTINHHGNDFGAVLIGGMQGKVKGGRAIQVPSGSTNNQLMAAMASYMGVPTANDKFGDPTICPSPISLT